MRGPPRIGGPVTPIALVIPPSAFLLDERCFPSLGVLKVAASLEARGYPVEMVDLSGVADYEGAIAVHARQSHATAYGITATSPQIPAAARVATAIREARPGAKLILGGPHVTVTLAAVKRETTSGRAHRALEQLLERFDVLVAGDGEGAIVPALGFERGIIDADDPKGALFLTGARLAETSMPARHLLDLSTYHYAIDGHPATPLIAQLGCPYECSFCSGRASPMLRRVRTRPTEQIVAEVEYLFHAYGYTGIMFFDDELNVSRTMVDLMRGLAALQDRLGIELRLRGFVKAELFTAEQASAMFEAGFRWLLCGFESGHPEILENIQKKATLADNDRAVDLAREAGIKVKALMSIGHAGESPETVEATRAWLLRTRPDDFDVTVITPYPGSPYFDRATESAPGVWTFTAKSGDRLHMDEVDYIHETRAYKGIPGEYVSLVWTDALAREELVHLRDDVEADARAKLGIPYNAGAPGIRFEASMGQTKLPPSILRTSPMVTA